MEKEEIQIFSKTSKTKIINIIEKENYKDLEENVLLTIALEKLPKNYNFEIYKSIKKIREISKEKKKKNPLIALQFPEGLLIFSLLISDILSTFAECETIILGDITYGACCIDDIGCSLLNCDLIIHYAHSCLKPNIITLVKVMYIFVEIKIDIEHLVKTIILNFPKENSDSLFFLGSLQYNSSLFVLKRKLIDCGYDKNNIIIPQNKPRVIGEVIGCTSPILEKKKDNCYVIFICD
jgi:2-(3-amino-3-carboxypropyl)histidine synthase